MRVHAEWYCNGLTEWMHTSYTCPGTLSYPEMAPFLAHVNAPYKSVCCARGLRVYACHSHGTPPYA